MPHYMLQVAYSSDSLAALSKNPANREEMARRAVESVGGRLVSFYYSFGEYDAILIFEAPDNSAAAGLSLHVGGTGAFKAGKTTPLLTADEALAALRTSGSVNYQPPG